MNKPTTDDQLRTISSIQRVFCEAGGRPGSRATLVSVKVAKPMLAVLWPFGFPARFADSGGAQTRGACPEVSRRAQTVRAFFPVSAALLGHTTRPGEIAEISNSLIRVNQLAELVLRFLEGLKQVRQRVGFGQGLSRAQGRDFFRVVIPEDLGRYLS